MKKNMKFPGWKVKTSHTFFSVWWHGTLGRNDKNIQLQGNRRKSAFCSNVCSHLILVEHFPIPTVILLRTTEVRQGCRLLHSGYSYFECNSTALKVTSVTSLLRIKPLSLISVFVFLFVKSHNYFHNSVAVRWQSVH